MKIWLIGIMLGMILCVAPSSAQSGYDGQCVVIGHGKIFAVPHNCPDQDLRNTVTVIETHDDSPVHMGYDMESYYGNPLRVCVSSALLQDCLPYRLGILHCRGSEFAVELIPWPDFCETGTITHSYGDTQPCEPPYQQSEGRTNLMGALIVLGLGLLIGGHHNQRNDQSSGNPPRYGHRRY